jgi:hypothetical protein
VHICRTRRSSGAAARRHTIGPICGRPRRSRRSSSSWTSAVPAGQQLADHRQRDIERAEKRDGDGGRRLPAMVVAVSAPDIDVLRTEQTELVVMTEGFTERRQRRAKVPIGRRSIRMGTLLLSGGRT